VAAFSALYAEVGDYLHDLGSDMDTRVKEWINLAQQDVATEAYWPWLLREDTLSTTADITTGTVAVTNGSATITISEAAIATTYEYGQYYFQVDDDEIWYPIASVASTTVGTLTSTYIGDTAAAASYTIRRVLYSLPSDISTILTVRKNSPPVRMRKITPGTLDVLDPSTEVTGDAYNYMLFGSDSSGYQQMYFHPPDTAADVVTLRYYMVLSDLSGDADISKIPVDFHEALVWGACWRGYRFLDDQQNAQTAKFEYDAIIRRMKRRYLTTPDDIIRKGAIDEYHTTPTHPRFPTDTITE